MSQWVKVEFYAQMPTGTVMTGLDPAETARTLVDAFGFSHVEAISAVVAADRGYRPDMRKEQPERTSRALPSARMPERSSLTRPHNLLT